MTVDQIRDHLGADSLAYLELDRMLTAITPGPGGFCTACMTGDYPTPIPASTTATAQTASRPQRRQPA